MIWEEVTDLAAHEKQICSPDEKMTPGRCLPYSPGLSMSAAAGPWNLPVRIAPAVNSSTAGFRWGVLKRAKPKSVNDLCAEALDCNENLTSTTIGRDFSLTLNRESGILETLRGVAPGVCV